MNAQSTLPASASFAPADALAYLSVDLDVTSPQWLQAGILAQRIDQQLTPEQLFNTLTESVFGSGVSIDPALFIGGEAALVVTDPDLGQVLGAAGELEDATGDPDDLLDQVGEFDPSIANGYVLVALPEDAEAAQAAMLDYQRERAQELGLALETTTYGDVEIVSMPADPTTGISGTSIARVDDAVIAAATPSDLETVIDVADGTNPSLADREVVAAVLSPLPADRLAVGVINGPAIADQSLGATPPSMNGVSSVVGSVNSLTAFTFGAESNGFRFDSRSASEGGEPILGANDNFAPSLVEQMPADTQIFVDGYDLGGTRLIDSAVVILANLFFGAMQGTVVPMEPAAGAAATPGAAEAQTLDEAADDAFGLLALLLGVDLRSDLIALLDGEFALGVWGIEGESVEHASAAFLSQTSNPELLGTTINGLINFLSFGAGSSLGATPEAADSSGLTSIDLSSNGVPVDLSVGVVEDELIVAVGEGAEVATTGSVERLVDNEVYLAATEELPTDRNALYFFNFMELGSTAESISGMIDLPVGDASTLASAEALAIVGFQDGLLAGTQGLLYIPEP